ncbi:MAG TPA: hypothetical protein VM681_07965 [Candidatus Thermoplasmatota archaeon]|nr:hypothetical protein [Candidatus Thermoplasmatota archaeon]
MGYETVDERAERLEGEAGSKIALEMELMRRHVVMLKAVLDNQPVGIIRLAEITGFPQHKVRYSLRVLEHEGLVAPSPAGAVTTAKVPEFLSQMRRLVREVSLAVDHVGKSVR